MVNRIATVAKYCLINYSKEDESKLDNRIDQTKNLEEFTSVEPEVNVKSEINEKIEHLEEEFEEHPTTEALNESMNQSPDIKDDALYEKVGGGMWKCKVCQKVSQKGGMKRHIEVHIEGVSYPCDICSKSFRSKTCLRQHQLTRHKNFH